MNARTERILERIRAIPEGFVRTYGDIDPRAPRFVGLVLSETTENLPWQRVVRADGSLPKGAKQRRLLLREGVPMRGNRVDMKEARFPPELDVEIGDPGHSGGRCFRRRSLGRP